MKALLSFHKLGNDSWVELPNLLRAHGVETCLTVRGQDDPENKFEVTFDSLPNYTVPDFWSALPISLDGVREYRKFEGSEFFPRISSQLNTMQNRRDFTGTFRQLERELRIRRILLVTFTAVLRQAPDFAAFDVTPHDHVNAAIEAVLRWLDIPIIFFQPSLVGPQSLPRTSLTEEFGYRIHPGIRDSFSAELEEVVGLANAAIFRLDGGAGTPKMSSQFDREKTAYSLGGRFRGALFFIRRLGKGLHFPSVNFSGHTFLPAPFRRLVELVLDWSLRRSLVDSIRKLSSAGPGSSESFALFALHYEPERCSIPEGFPFSSQFDAVVAARALLPEHVHLFVKEHFSQSASALRGTLGRSPEYYTVLGDIPGVTVLGIEAKTREIILNAQCVFTLTGKVGIEAALLGTPVLVGGQPWWKGMPGTGTLSEILTDSDYSEFVALAMPARTEVFDWLDEKFRDSLVPVLGDATLDRYESRISKLPARYGDLQLAVLLDVLRSFISTISRD